MSDQTKVDELYDALVGTPAVEGFMPFVRAELRTLRAGQAEIGRESLAWQKAHIAEHQKRENEANEVSRDYRRTALDFAKQAALALLAAVLSIVGYSNVFHRGP